MQTIGIQAFDDTELSKIVQSNMLQGFSNSTYVSVTLLSPSILTVNKTNSSSAMVWITCKYSGFVSFTGSPSTSNQLGQMILNVFGTSPNVDYFISSLHATNQSYLQTVKDVKVELITDPNSSNAEQINARKHNSSLPYVVVGSVLSLIILSITVYFVCKNKKVSGYNKSCDDDIPATPPLDSDMSPGYDGEASKQQDMCKKNTTLLGIEAKDVYIESTHESDDFRNDNLSSICVSLNRILEERGVSSQECNSQLTRASFGNMCSEVNPSQTEDLSWTLIPSPDSKPSFDEYDMRNCCAYDNPMEHDESTKRLFENELSSNPLYRDYIQSNHMKDASAMNASPRTQVSLTLTPMPKHRSESFDMRNRDADVASIGLEDSDPTKTSLYGLSPSFPKMPCPVEDDERITVSDPLLQKALSPRMTTLDTKLSYEEYGIQNCCNFDSELKNRLFNRPMSL